ncbi:hypothetical protein BU24DRAFT_50955 [Aaosphaeria arxii CBS 175.79]|uniref:Zn(2)-C6 fungal-type domain-containing protein n=1 Tax=Aaosphaeria arxii CBS 175.79 TaxID=1450172 RepID=A0A6A5XDQ4_9PLEO|nr:uncharacterized protein BU24DRAFT_50955 [Aaosphaeria arxii CBS 175.79]KAF2011010.1 hypothetical protein BU24DRAFT_50955 [Aaosphaeria arxii CBS 175.79]
MFHTFQSSVGLRSPGADGDGTTNKPTRAAGSRRISTSNACVECRRRKIRCDGTQPCGQCQWYQHPEACGYSKPAQRVVPSRKLVDKLSNNIEQYKAVLAKLYPSKDLESLTSMPREELLELALSSPAVATSPQGENAQAISEVVSHGSEGAESLEALEQAPQEDPYWDEQRKHIGRVQGISDDVNGLSMSVDKLSSYVGISSITAALKVIVRCAPHAKPMIASNNQETAVPSRAGSPPPELLDTSPLALPTPAQGQELIESYFERVHLFFPLIEERKFWSTYMYSNRKDSPWLALLNMVFALGSLASSTSDNEAHYVYFIRSRKHLTLESFGSGNLEVLQALAIMSGYYMHYLNRPNEAHSLMGGTLRMATALGLHREYSDCKGESSKYLNVKTPSETDSISPEMRRRIWWSLFCLDAWASTTTGRPSLGRMGPSITVLPPGSIRNAATPTPLQPSTPQYIEQLKVLPLVHNAEFCKIATKIQDRLVESPLLTPSETSAYDDEILRWYDELPSILSDMGESCPDFLRRVRHVMKWRFQNIRLVLHRPVLLNTALRRCAFVNLSAEEKVAVGKCRLVAAKTIEDISSECLPDLISGWNAVWFVFQACMVPLVSLFSDHSMPEEAEKWRASIETALAFFERIQPWSIAAKRSMDAVSRLYQTSKAQFQQQQQQQQQQQLHMQPPEHTQQHNNGHHAQFNGHNIPQMGSHFEYNGIPDVTGLSMNPNAVGTWNGDPAAMQQLNGFWDDMMWDTNLPDMLDTPFGLSNEYEFQGAAQDTGAPCWMQGN